MRSLFLIFSASRNASTVINITVTRDTKTLYHDSYLLHNFFPSEFEVIYDKIKYLERTLQRGGSK